MENKNIYKRISLCGDVYFERPRFLRDFIFKLHEKYGYKLKIFTRGYDKGAEKWIKKYSMYFGVNYNEYNPAFTSKNMHSVMPSYYFNKKYHYTQLLHVNYLLSNNTDELVFFDSQREKKLHEQELIKSFEKLNKRVLIVY
jgi:hypothetical protein